MKNIIVILLVLIASCNEQPKQEPMKFSAGIISPGADEITYNENGDTVVWQSKDTTVTFTSSYKVWNKVVKPKKTEPVKSGYFALEKSEPIVLSGKSNLVIENKRIANAPGVAAALTNCSNITFRNCFFDGAALEAITIYNCKNITVEKCLFARVETGVYASTSQTIVVRGNQFVNVRQRVSSTGSRSRGQFVQFNTVTGAGNIVENNKGENFAGESDPEDLISMFKSSGTAASPILIRGNMFRGGGPSKSGGGIVCGDYGGNYITIENNWLVNPGNYGIAIAGGNYNSLIGNRVYSDFHDYNNAGAIIWAQGGVTGSNATFINNRINWPYKLGGQNNVFINGNLSVVKNSGNVYNEKLEAMIPDFPKVLIDFITPEELLTIRK